MSGPDRRRARSSLKQVDLVGMGVAALVLHFKVLTCNRRMLLRSSWSTLTLDGSLQDCRSPRLLCIEAARRSHPG